MSLPVWESIIDDCLYRESQDYLDEQEYFNHLNFEDELMRWVEILGYDPGIKFYLGYDESQELEVITYQRYREEEKRKINLYLKSRKNKSDNILKTA